MDQPREEVDYAILYKTFLSRETPLPLICFDSRVGEVPRCRLPFPPERSGFSWNSRLERAKEEIPRAVFRPMKPKIYKRIDDYCQVNQNVTIKTNLSLEVPIKRGRGRPKKDSSVTYIKPSESDVSNCTTSVENDEIGIIRPERHYLRNNLMKTTDNCEYDLDDQGN